METQLSLHPLEEDRPTLQLQLSEDNLQLHSKLEEFSHLVEVEPPTPRAQQLLITLGSTLEQQLPALHHSTLEVLEEEEELEQLPPVQPTCLVRQVEATTSRPPSALGLRLSSALELEVLLLLEVVEELEAPCSVSGPEVTSLEPRHLRGELPLLGGPGSEESSAVQ